VAWAALLKPPALTDRAVGALLRALFEFDLEYLEMHPATPALYRAGVRYEREPEGQERWLSIPHVLAQRWGDCEDLACWRAAELVLAGERTARPVFKSRWSPRGHLYHILVERADGSIEDPSRKLGM